MVCFTLHLNLNRKYVRVCWVRVWKPLCEFPFRTCCEFWHRHNKQTIGSDSGAVPSSYKLSLLSSVELPVVLLYSTRFIYLITLFLYHTHAQHTHTLVMLYRSAAPMMSCSNWSERKRVSGQRTECNNWCYSTSINNLFDQIVRLVDDSIFASFVYFTR